MYFYLYYILLIFIISNVQSICDIEIKKSGIYPMKPGDVGMVFFIDLYNPCTEKFHINVKMAECTELIGENEEETSAMHLIGGYMGILYKKSVLTPTLIYPNMYLYNRQGECTIIVSKTGENHVTLPIRVKIQFSTVPTAGLIPPEIYSFYRKRSLKYCESPDQDQLENCSPVDCMMKYLGERNYYNSRFKRCQKVPICVSDGLKDDPDVSYVPTSNRCRNLASCITENDINLLEDGTIMNNTKHTISSRGLILCCNHGVIDNNNGICRCEEDYMSAEPDIDNYVPGLSVYHMCNIRVDSWHAANFPKLRSTIFGFAILAVIITMVVLLMTFCLYGVYIYLNAEDTSSPFDNVSEESTDSGCKALDEEEIIKLNKHNKN